MKKNLIFIVLWFLSICVMLVSKDILTMVISGSISFFIAFFFGRSSKKVETVEKNDKNIQPDQKEEVKELKNS